MNGNGASNQQNDLTKDGGVLKTIKNQGNPESHHPLKGDTVFVHYVGTLKETGEEFDSSRGKGEPFRFTIGRGQVTTSPKIFMHLINN